jgi:hypothetical protein
MTFELVRIGWPNTAAVLALALMPVVALTVATDRRPTVIAIERAEPAASCQQPAGCIEIAAADAAADTIVE